jgi:hypothetical protein
LALQQSDILAELLDLEIAFNDERLQVLDIVGK